MLGIEDVNIVAGSIMSARFSESSNDSFVFGEVEINGRQADNMLEVNVRIRLDQLRPAHWPENDEDDPELVLIENEREVEGEYSAVRSFGSKIQCSLSLCFRLLFDVLPERP